MRPATLDPSHARSIVEARLGREPQDMLEAAVALEAWAGVPAGDALATAGAMMRAGDPESQPSAGRLPRAAARQGVAMEAISFAIAVIAIACWAAPLSRSLGQDVVERALVCALPMTLALQWGLASRFLSRPDGLAHLGRRPWTVALAALALVAAPSAVLGLGGLVAGLLTVTWTGGAILIRRRWAPAYAALVVVAGAAMLAGLLAPLVLGATAAIAAAGVAAALRARTLVPAQSPGRWTRALAAAVIGAGLGALLVADRSVDWTVGSMPAIALLPSSLASFWGGRHLWRFQQAIPEALSGVAVADTGARGLARRPMGVLLGAVGRLVLLTAGLSLVVLAVAALFELRTSGESVLVGFGLVALATMLVGLLESVGRAPWAIAAVVAGVAGEAVAPPELASMPGGRLILGASIAVVVVLPMVVAVLARPALTLATSIGIR
ncbi:MAG: hypothetical protein QOF04_3151 [Solirubrobacteraceae bacterium]|jgi:hypothetical protein|nr:hypothetical protein [Solirubrobacteraceae bacterium]